MTKNAYKKLAAAIALATSVTAAPGLTFAAEADTADTVANALGAESGAAEQMAADAASASGEATTAAPETVDATADETTVTEETATADDTTSTPVATEATASEVPATTEETTIADAVAAESDATVSSLASGAKSTTEEVSDRVRDWAKLRPTEAQIEAYKKQNEGQTIVDVVFDGATDTTLATAKSAIHMRTGDIYTAKGLDADLDALISTGYYYDLFPTFETVPEGVVLTYHVLENPILKSVAITGNTVETTDDLMSLVTLEPGKMLNSVTLKRNVQAIQEKYREDGYILAKITDLNIDKDGNLTIKLNEGKIESFKIKGNEKTKDYVILREMRQKPGEPFNAKKTQRSWQRVNNLGFFEEVTPKVQPGVEPNAVIVEWNVKEKRTGTFSVGAGYSSQDGVIGMIAIGDTNFRGTGDAINITYEFSGDDEDSHGYSFSYRRPWLDQKQTTGTFRIYNRTYEYDDYDENGDHIESYMRHYSGGEITLGRPVSEYSTNYITLRNRKDQYVKQTEVGNLNGHGSGATHKKWEEDNFGTTRAVILQHVTDTRDNVYFPTMGGRVALTGELGGFGGDFDYRKADIEDQRYFKAGKNQVWALRGQYGWSDGDISEYARFKVGGQNSLRGYRDDQFRGEHMFLATLEYRFPIVSKVQGALFTDWGSAWEDDLWPDDIHGSVGIGMSLVTPLGPVRLDYGRGDDGGRVHFSVGGTF
ncbi:MAG: BamA/TamA family outer membrane protein [Selenomonas sp.]|uniref:BamA/TamA family outer membrane protein n=1 Tax=Selenomonas sp. TaxID=2053611 RepID=UPI0025D178C0|nr:BamA/TamA family outer membrane protein [Selenomonas sp.]MCI6086981.1 BamA/TamA family outer membrane protein [Selenomonas sp.]